MMKLRSPPLAYGLVLFMGAAMAPFLFSLDETMLGYGRRSMSNGSLYSLTDEEEFSNLQRTEEIDRSIETRAQMNDAEDKCSRIMVYLPDRFAKHGHGSQINSYIIAVNTATYLDRALVLVEPPLDLNHERVISYAGGSQFGCPVDAFKETVTKTSSWRREDLREDFPLGFSRLVKQPAWLSHGCEVPCAQKYNYEGWFRLIHGPLDEITCTNPDGTIANVVVTGGSSLRSSFRENEAAMTKDHPSPQTEKWALNLGATPGEALTFSAIRSPPEIWDFALGLMNKAGFLQFQPWIARDVELLLKTFPLPLQQEYDAIHVRRGDKLVEEARGDVILYWRSQGHTDYQNLPTDYVPFAHYLSKWDGPETCVRNDAGDLQIMKHNVYIATDDPVVVHEEIAALPNHINENTILWNDCYQLSFFFNPTDASAFHLNGDGEEGFDEGHEAQAESDSCFDRYNRNIASVADMMILSKARIFIGEFNSNWGRVIRTMRVRLNKEGSDRPTKTLDTRIAWGRTRPLPPGY